MTANGVLKSLKPEGWPDRINVGRAVVRFPNGTESGSWYSRPQGDDETAEYIRRDPAVLAALPEVRALVEAETERCAKVAVDRWASHKASADKTFEMDYDGARQDAVIKGAYADEARAIAAAIRAKGGEA